MDGSAGRMLWLGWLYLTAACDSRDDRKKPEPDTPPLECPEGTIADGEDCVPEACGVGPWGDLFVDDETIFVDAAAAEGGDGSDGAPFSSIQAGIDAAGAAGGGLVAVAAGTYPENVIADSDHAGVVLAGRCADLVVLDGSTGGSGDAGLTIDTSAASVEISGLTVQGAPYIGVLVVTGDVTLRGLRIAQNSHAGLYVMSYGFSPITRLLAEDCALSENIGPGVYFEGPKVEATLRRVLVQDSQRANPGALAYGVGVSDGTVLSLESSEIARNSSVGLVSWGEGTSVEVTDTLIHGTLPNDDGLFGNGIQAMGGASLTLDGCEIAENTHSGVTAGEDGTEVVIRASLIRDTLPTADGAHGSGVEVGSGASLTIEASEIRGFRLFGVGVTGAGTVARLDGTSVRDAREGDLEFGGAGVVVLDGATAYLDACTVAEVAGVGIEAVQSGSSVIVTDTLVQGTRTVGSLGMWGIGMAAGMGGTLEATDSEVSDSGAFGVLVTNPDSRATLTDVAISGTRRGEAYTAGVGATIADEAVLDATRLTVSGSEGPGLYAMSRGSRLTCAGCTVQDNRFAGAVVEQGALMALSDGTISSTSVDSNLGGGVGIWASAEETKPTSLVVTGTSVSANPIGGVWLSGPGSYHLEGSDLHGGEGETRGALVRCGDALYARDVPDLGDGVGLYLAGNTLRDGHGAGLFLDGATATLAGNTWTSNTVDVVAQGAACAQPPEGLEAEPVTSTELCPIWDYSTCGDEFSFYLELALPEG